MYRVLLAIDMLYLAAHADPGVYLRIYDPCSNASAIYKVYMCIYAYCVECAYVKVVLMYSLEASEYFSCRVFHGLLSSSRTSIDVLLVLLLCQYIRVYIAQFIDAHLPLTRE